MAYFARTDVETLLNITLTPNGQNLVDALIPAIEARANRFCNREWDASTITEVFDGGQQIFFPRLSPISSIVSIVVDGHVLAPGEYFAYGSYLRLDYPAATGNRNVTIVYTANVPLPADVKHALIRWAAEIFKSAEDAGKTAKRVRFGPAEVEYLVQDGMPNIVEDVLRSYRLSPV